MTTLWLAEGQGTALIDCFDGGSVGALLHLVMVWLGGLGCMKSAKKLLLSHVSCTCIAQFFKTLLPVHLCSETLFSSNICFNAIPSIATLIFRIMLENLASIKIPKSLTSALQLLQLFTQSGHFYWTSGIVERSKLPKLLQKFAAFRIDRDAPGRIYDKSKKLASVHLVLLDAPNNDLPLQWVLVSTQGKGGLNDQEAINVGKVADTRLTGQHLQWGNYELLHIEKCVTVTRDVKTKKGEILENRKATIKSTTWTWRLTRERFSAHQALIVACAKRKNTHELDVEIAALSMMPMFSGVRGQVLKLHAEARKVCGKFGCALPPLPRLPILTKQPVYADPPKTLRNICEKRSAE